MQQLRLIGVLTISFFLCSGEALLAQTEKELAQAVNTARNADASLQTRVAAINKLGQMGAKAQPATSVLAEVARSPDPTLRRPAIDALGKIGGKESVASLMPILKNGKDPMLLEAVRAAGKIGPPAEEAVPVLVDYALAAGKSGLQYKDEQLYREIVSAILKIAQAREVRSQSLLKILHAPPLSKRALVKPGEKIYESLARREVAIALAKMGGKDAAQAVPVLVDLLKPIFREYAPGGPRAGKPLDPSGPLSPYYNNLGTVEIIDALGETGATARPALPVLRACLRHPADGVQKAAERAIDKVK